jgi:superfamily II DNA or RNA helicase
MELRDFQRECHDSIIEKWRMHTSTLAVLATGLGKTIIVAHVIKSQQPRRALVLAHRAELIYQACDKIRRAVGLECEIEMADLTASTNLFHRTPVVVATVQTMKDRLHKFKPEDFGVVVIDETHHATSPIYSKIISHFRQNPDLKILGVTATPDRADEEALGQVFESVAFDYDILDGVQNGWLVDVTQQFVAVKGLDFSHMRTTAGDLNGADLAKVMEAEKTIQGVCHPSLEVIHGLAPQSLTQVPVEQWGQLLGKLKARRTIVFTASVVQAEACCAILNRGRDGLAEWVCGETAKDKRAEILSRFASGETAVVCNCGVLTEGFDNPAVEVIIMARPTKSRSLYAQMVGRSTRTLPGLVDNLTEASARLAAIEASNKPYCRIIDFVGNSGRHKLMTAFDILGGKHSQEIVERAIRSTKAGDKPVMVCRRMSNEELKEKQEKLEAAERARRAIEARKSKMIAKARFETRDVNPFHNQSHRPLHDPFNAWRGERTLSEKQRRVLSKRGYNPDKLAYGAAKALIGRIAEKEGWGKPKVIHESQSNI